MQSGDDARDHASGAFAPLAAELDAWAAAGRTATLWWRDDDAVAPVPAFHALMRLAARHSVPIAVAAVARDAEPALAGALADGACIVQHGYAHANHAPAGERSAEYGAHRPVASMCDEIARGRDRLAERFGARFVPVFVPPWNRMSETLVAPLGSLGFRGLSTFTARVDARAAPGVVQANCHVDPIHWRDGARFRGISWTVDAFCEHLAARREGRVDGDEPTGLLTHHLRHADAIWSFLDELCAFLGGKAVRWLPADEIFAQ